jgi:hypothetical protein
MNWIYLAEDRENWRALITKVVNLRAVNMEFIN